MRILHTEWSLGWGGQEIRIIAEMEAFRERGYQMVLVARRDSRILVEAAKRDFEHHALEFGFMGNPITIFKLGQIIRKADADIVHTHSSRDSWIGAITGNLLGVPVVRSRHLSSVIKHKPGNGLIYRRLPSAIIASGRHIAEQLVNEIGCNPEEVFSVPAGADEQRFQPNSSYRSQVRGELGIPATAPVVGMVAVLRSWKGHRVIIDAMQKLMQGNPDLHLVLVGDGPQYDSLNQFARELGIEKNTHFVGYRQDVERYFPAFDVHVLPSIKNEATSQVVPQAMLCGVANIVSNAGGLTEVIQSEENGLVVPANDVSSLRVALERLLSDAQLRQRFGAAGREDALQRFTFTAQIDATEAVYKGLVGK